LAELVELGDGVFVGLGEQVAAAVVVEGHVGVLEVVGA
jgi:hypothetical protein